MTTCAHTVKKKVIFTEKILTPVAGIILQKYSKKVNLSYKQTNKLKLNKYIKYKLNSPYYQGNAATKIHLYFYRTDHHHNSTGGKEKYT